MTDNPFERYDIDPLQGPEGITQRFRALIEEARDDAERDALRAAWEQLTMHPEERLVAALGTFPETRPVQAAPPMLPPLASPRAALDWRDVGLVPAVAAALSPHPRELPRVLPPLAEDSMVALASGSDDSSS